MRLITLIFFYFSILYSGPSAFAEDGKNYNYSDLPLETGEWQVNGKNLKDGTTWFYIFYENGQFIYTENGGKESYEGTYRFKENGFCTMPDGWQTEQCTTRRFFGGKPVWFLEDKQSYSSEITGIYRIRELVPRNTTTPLVSSTRPKACENVSNFCTQLSLKAAACGWVAHEGANRALDTDTGSAGSAIAGASCTALMSTAEGLEIDIIDLAISATSSAIMSEAEESFKKGEFLSGIVQGLVGAGVGVVGAAKCQATLEQACR